MATLGLGLLRVQMRRRQTPHCRPQPHIHMLLSTTGDPDLTPRQRLDAHGIARVSGLRIGLQVLLLYINSVFLWIPPVLFRLS